MPVHDSATTIMDAILHATPGNPIPGDPIVGFFSGYRGTRLRYAIFRGEGSLAKGTVVLLQGRNECIEKYFETIRELNARGLWVATFDLRGQGGSDRLMPNARPGHVRRFSDYERDLEAFIEQVVLPDTRLPFFILAHSTGGLIALSAAPRLTNRIERMVLTAPFVGLGGQKLSRNSVFVLAGLMSSLGLGGRCLTADRLERPFDNNPLTSDPERFARNQAIAAQHPELFLGPPTARWLFESLKTIRRVQRPEYLYAITIPTVVIVPARDAVVPYADQERMSQYFRAAQFVPVPGARHEILQERDRYRLQALAAIQAFIPGGDPEAEQPA